MKRYDREQAPAGWRRLHQEDFCQALALPSGRKYQAEGGPSLEDCFELLRRATSVPATETIRFLDHVFLNFLMSRKMAMSIGGEYRADYVRDRHLERMFEQVGLGAAAARRRLRRIADQAPAAALQGAAGVLEVMARARERQQELPLALEAIAATAEGVPSLVVRTTERLFESDEVGRGMPGRLDVITSYASELDAIADRLQPEIERHIAALQPYTRAIGALIRLMERSAAVRRRGGDLAGALRALAASMRQTATRLGELIDSIERSASVAEVLRARSARLVASLRRVLGSAAAIEDLDRRLSALGFAADSAKQP